MSTAFLGLQTYIPNIVPPLVSPGLPLWPLVTPNDANEKKGDNSSKTVVNGFSKKLKQYPESFPLLNGGLKSSKIIRICLFAELAKKIV